MNRLLLQSHRRLITRVSRNHSLQVRFCGAQVRKARKARSSEEAPRSKRRRVTRGSNARATAEESEEEVEEVEVAAENNEPVKEDPIPEQPKRRTRRAAKVDDDEEPDPEPEEAKTRTRFKDRRSKVAGSAMADQVIDQIGDLAETEGATMKACTSFKASMYVLGIPIYCASAYFNIFSGNFAIAWFVHKMTPWAVWAPLNKRQAENFRARHPGLKRCRFSMKLTDSFRQDPLEFHHHVREVAGRQQVETSERMRGVFMQRKATLENHIKYGLAFDMADNQRSIFTIPVIFAGCHLVDVQSMMQTWGVWYDPVMTWAIPAAGTAYILRFLAPAAFGRAVKAIHYDLLPGHSGDKR